MSEIKFLDLFNLKADTKKAYFKLSLRKGTQYTSALVSLFLLISFIIEIKNDTVISKDVIYKYVSISLIPFLCTYFLFKSSVNFDYKTAITGYKLYNISLFVQLIALIVIAITLHQPLINLAKDETISQYNNNNSNRILDEILRNTTLENNTDSFAVNDTEKNNNTDYIFINDANSGNTTETKEQNKNSKNTNEDQNNNKDNNTKTNSDNKSQTNNINKDEKSYSIKNNITKSDLLNYAITALFLIWELYGNFIVYNYTKQINAGNDAFVDGQPFNRYVEDLAPSENSSRENTPRNNAMPDPRNNSANIELGARV